MNATLIERVIAACEGGELTQALIDECKAVLDQPIAERFDLTRYVANLDLKQVNYAADDMQVLIQEAKENIASDLDSL